MKDYTDLPFTKRVYNINPYKKEESAKVIFVDGNVAIFDKTIFYGESGGQIYDVGNIFAKEDTSNNNTIINVQHKQGKKPTVKDRDILIPDIEVETKILHFFENPVKFKVGESVIMRIDWSRRYEIMKNHTLAHFFFYAIKQIYLENNIPFALRGCSIDENKASFSLDYKFTLEEWENIKKITLDTIELGYSIKMDQDIDYDTVYYWKYGDIVIPCGGTHIKETQEIIKDIYFSKKNSGKNSCRLYISCKNI